MQTAPFLLLKKMVSLPHDLLKNSSHEKALQPDATSAFCWWDWNKMPLCAPLVPNGHGQGQVTSYAILKDERAVTLGAIFPNLRNTSLASKVKSVMVNKNLNETAQVKEVYLNVKIMLCRFHVLKTMHSGINQHSGRAPSNITGFGWADDVC